MTEQSKALQLADRIETQALTFRDKAEAAAELRRLHEEITQLRHAAAATNRCIADLAAQRDALLETLKLIAFAENSALDLAYCKGIARAAIKKAEENI
jgi:hypothetical protein